MLSRLTSTGTMSAGAYRKKLARRAQGPGEGKGGAQGAGLGPRGPTLFPLVTRLWCMLGFQRAILPIQ